MPYLKKIFNCENKVIVITGAAGYLCSEISRSFANVKAKVSLLDINEKKLFLISKELKKNGAKIVSFKTDVSKKKELKQSLDFTLKSFGDVDVLINGAGINAPTPFKEISEKEWDKILSVNLKGTMLACQVYGEYMVNKKKGSIINFSSVSSGPPLSKAFAYSVSKAGVKNLTQNLAREWASKGVRVNAIRPGFFPTEWSKKNFIDKERYNSIINHTPMKRYGNPKELVGAFFWLASDASSFVTGAEVTVDGGFTTKTI